MAVKITDTCIACGSCIDECPMRLWRDWDDLNRYKFALDEEGDHLGFIYDIEKGKLKDPRDVDSTSESRKEFDHYMDGYVNEWKLDSMLIFQMIGVNNKLLYSKIPSINCQTRSPNPPQGYPNAPRYYSPERLEIIYKRHKLDRLLDPRIPAIYRYNFPEDLRAKIRAYAKEHNIKE